MNDEEGSFVIFSKNKLWYSSKKSSDDTVELNKAKVVRGVNKIRNAAKNKRVVEFQIFDDIMKLQTDPYWISFFDECAIGKLPRGFKFMNNIIYYRVKTKTMELMVSENIEEAEIMIKKFIYEHAGIISPIDLKIKRESEETRMYNISAIDNIQWSSIRNEKDQSVILSFFIEAVKDYYNLNFEECKSLYQLIKLGLISGYLTSENIVMENGSITEIIGLEYIEKEKRFIINEDLQRNVKPYKKVSNDDTLTSKTSEENDITSQSKTCLVKYWGKYLNELNNKRYKKI
jgi:hypothetical protein